MICYEIFDSPVGKILASSDDGGINLLEFWSPEQPSGNLASVTPLNGTEPERKRNIHLNSLGKELEEYFSGRLKCFSVPVVMIGTSFQKLVWDELLKIKYGETRSYMDQARAIGRPEAIRAVAGANGANPVSIVIPCHRIIGSDGKLTGYGGGIWRKRWLLEHERKYSSTGSPGMLF